MSAGHIALGCLVLAVLIFVADDFVGRYSHWRKKRDLHIRAKELARFNIGVAFRGARAVDKNRFLS